MSKLTKIIIPLIDDNISKDDISEDTGFIDAYTEDINRPFLDSHIFLMYNWEDKKSTKVFYKFRSISSFYGYKIIYLNGKAYIVYTFTSNSLINRLKRGIAILRDVNKQRILQFWQFTDPWITLNVMRGTIACDPPQDVLPEEDYLPE